MAELSNPRRYYLHQRIEARQVEDDSERVWQAKQEAQPGTALPSDFPWRAELETMGYTAREDIDGADADELVRAGLTERQANDVISAAKAL